MKKFSFLLNVLKMKCPRCRRDYLFKKKMTFHPAKIFDMKESCASCGLKYMLEPSFYFGAMYIAYGISVGVALFIFLLGSYIFELSIGENLVLVFSLLLFTTPFQLRLSRSIWIHIFVKHKSKK